MSRIILFKYHATEALSPKTPTPATITLLNQKNPSSSSTISVLCLVISVLALIVILLGVLHLIFKFLQKSPTFFQSRNLNPNSDVFSSSNQLQDLFFLHNSGLDQTAIDALPVFFYGNVTMSLKEPFDCAVCLSEFFDTDKLRLLPVCSHTFHLHCIDTWLLSILYLPSLQTITLNLKHLHQQVEEGRASLAERVLSGRFGRFKTLNESQSQQHEGETGMGVPRCYSMGTHQYFECDQYYVVPLTSS